MGTNNNNFLLVQLRHHLLHLHNNKIKIKIKINKINSRMHGGAPPATEASLPHKPSKATTSVNTVSARLLTSHAQRRAANEPALISSPFLITSNKHTRQISRWVSLISRGMCRKPNRDILVSSVARSSW